MLTPLIPTECGWALGGVGYGHITPTFEVQNGRTMTNQLQKWIRHPKNRGGVVPMGPKGAKIWSGDLGGLKKAISANWVVAFSGPSFGPFLDF